PSDADRHETPRFRLPGFAPLALLIAKGLKLVGYRQTGTGTTAIQGRAPAVMIVREVMRSRLSAFVLLLVTACGSAGPYGYSRTYAPLSAEEDAADGAHEYDPVMAERDPAEWKKPKVSVFG